MANLEEILQKRCPKAKTYRKVSELSLINNDFIGVEFELENLERNFMAKADMSYWARHDDQSLRGSSMEFVFDGPQQGDTAIVALEQLFDAFQSKSLETHATYRTSMHIHINMLDLNHYETAMVMIVAGLADETLFGLTSPLRRSCGFCRPSASAIFPRAGALLLENLEMLTSVIDYRYYSINTDALSKFGTIEFRHFATPHTLQDTIVLINHCMKIKDIGRALALEMPIREKAKWTNDALYERATQLLKDHFQDAYKQGTTQGDFDELITLGRDTREKPLKLRKALHQFKTTARPLYGVDRQTARPTTVGTPIWVTGETDALMADADMNRLLQNTATPQF